MDEVNKRLSWLRVEEEKCWVRMGRIQQLSRVIKAAQREYEDLALGSLQTTPQGSSYQNSNSQREGSQTGGPLSSTELSRRPRPTPCEWLNQQPNLERQSSQKSCRKCSSELSNGQRTAPGRRQNQVLIQELQDDQEGKANLPAARMWAGWVSDQKSNSQLQKNRKSDHKDSAEPSKKLITAAERCPNVGSNPEMRSSQQDEPKSSTELPRSQRVPSEGRQDQVPTQEENRTEVCLQKDAKEATKFQDCLRGKDEEVEDPPDLRTEERTLAPTECRRNEEVMAKLKASLLNETRLRGLVEQAVKMWE